MRLTENVNGKGARAFMSFLGWPSSTGTTISVLACIAHELRCIYMRIKLAILMDGSAERRLTENVEGEGPRAFILLLG